MTETVQVEAARVPDRDRLLEELRAGIKHKGTIYIRPPLS
jgi:hypothetical protein